MKTQQSFIHDSTYIYIPLRSMHNKRFVHMQDVLSHRKNFMEQKKSPTELIEDPYVQGMRDSNPH